MFRAIQLIFVPEAVWEKLVLQKKGWVGAFFLHLLPVMCLSAAVEGYSLVRWGDRRGQFNYLVHIQQDLALRYEAVQVTLGLLVFFLGAKLIQWVATSFSSGPRYSACLLALVYGLTPFYLVKTLDAIPAMNTWLCYAISMVCALPSLYHGVPRMLMLEQTKAFGVYLSSVLVITFLTGLAHALAVAVLRGSINL